MIKKLVILCLTSVFFACGGEATIVLTADGQSYASGKYSYNFGDIRISDSVSRNFVLKVSGAKAEETKVSCDSDYFRAVSVGSGDTVTVTVSNVPQSQSGFYLANVRVAAGTASFCFGVSARQTDTVPSTKLEWPENRTVSVSDLAFESVLSGEIDSASWVYRDGAAQTENQLASVPEGSSVLFPLTGGGSLGFFETGIYPLKSDMTLDILIQSFDSSVGNGGYVSLPVSLSFSESDWLTVGILVTSGRLTVFQGDTVVTDFSFSDNSNGLDKVFPMLAFGLGAQKGGFFVHSSVTYSEMFAQEDAVNRFIAEIGEQMLVFDKVNSYEFASMSQDEYNSFAAGATVSEEFSFEENKGLTHSANGSIAFSSENINTVPWDCIQMTVQWTSDYKPNFFLHDGSDPPYGISFYKASASQNCFLFDGESGAWNGGESDRSTSFSHAAEIPCLLGIFQDSTSNMMTAFDDYNPHTFTWTGAKSFSDYTNFTFAFNNDADGKAGSLTIQDMSFFKSRVLTVGK